MKKLLGLNDKINFGRYNGRTIREIIVIDASYFKYRFSFLTKESQKYVLSILDNK